MLIDGLTYYLTSTSAQWMNVPTAIITSRSILPLGGGIPGYGIVGTSMNTPEALSRTELMPRTPDWAANTGIWAPSIARFGNRFVMFFAARRKDPVPDPVNPECVGRAFASDPQGPYVPDDGPFWCGLGGIHGALDPFVFRSPTGTINLLMAAGGTSTTLWSVPLSTSAGALGAAVPILRMQHPWEVWFNENPSMAFDGTDYVLTYSSGDWRYSSYSTGVARCATPQGPCTSSRTGPWLSTMGRVSGPGGFSFFLDTHGRSMGVFHAYVDGQLALFGTRHSFIRSVKLSRNSIALDETSDGPPMPPTPTSAVEPSVSTTTTIVAPVTSTTSSTTSTTSTTSSITSTTSSITSTTVPGRTRSPD